MGKQAHPDIQDAFTQGYVEALFASGIRQCERCCGNGELIADEARYLSPRPGDIGDEAVADCPNCDGRGEFTLGGFSDLAPEAIAMILKDCAAFWETFKAVWLAHYAEDDEDSTAAGRDFWHTRNGYGCGFLGGDWPEPYATTLADAATALGGAVAYVGDDGKVYLRDGGRA